MPELISIHIPKTAGRSLLTMLNRVYGEKHVLVVNRKLFREDREAALAELRKQITPDIKVIHGHVHVSDIKEVIDEYPGARLIAFVREPASRVVSHYFHEKRILSETGSLSAKKQVPVDTVLNYAAHPEAQNVMTRFMAGVPLERFYFIGVFENLENELNRLSAMMKWPGMEIPKENINEAHTAHRATVSDEEREMIRSLNREDEALYDKVKSGNLLKKHQIKCWIASFPRSGNTYFRNILYYVYGIESGTWHKETAFPVDDDYDQFPFVKTHLLPNELMPDDAAIPAIYLIRDGRDAVVSIAHQRSDLVAPGSDYHENLKEAIVAADGSFFGGWSANVNAWLLRARLVIRYEDLIRDPQAVFKRVEQFIDLPVADWSKLPTFEQLKTGKPKYGGVSKLTDPKFNPEEFSQKFFRKGKSGGWREEMLPEMQDLFWNYHGETMERMGYEPHVASCTQNRYTDFKAMKLLGMDVKSEAKTCSVLIEASKLTQPGNDGVKRYLTELLKGFEEVVKYGDGSFRFELLVGKKFLPLSSYRQMLRLESDELHEYEKVLMGFKGVIKKVLPETVYEAGASVYRKTDIRKILKFIQAKKSVDKELGFYRELELKKDDVDVLLIPLPQNADHLKNLSHRFVVTVHDLTHRFMPQYHEAANIELAEAGMKFITEKHPGVLAVSQCTANDLAVHYGLNPEKVNVVYETADPDLFRWNVNRDLANQVREKYGLGVKPFLLTLSTIEPRKNLPNTIRAFNLLLEKYPGLDVNLVIAGKVGWKPGHLPKELHLDNQRIRFTGFIDDRDLSVVYSEALALCYLSFYEGFGLPPLEAMRCRTPVIYASNSSLTEIIGETGLSSDAEDVDAIMKNMYTMITNGTLRSELASKAHRRSFMFSRRRMTVETLREFIVQSL